MKTKIVGYISTKELNWWIKTPIEKSNGTPLILEIWKDGEDLRECARGMRIVKVTVELKSKAKVRN